MPKYVTASENPVGGRQAGSGNINHSLLCLFSAGRGLPLAAPCLLSHPETIFEVINFFAK